MNVTIEYYPNSHAESTLGVSSKTRQRDFKVLRKYFSADDFPVSKRSFGLSGEAFELWARYRILVAERGRKDAIKQLIKEYKYS